MEVLPSVRANWEIGIADWDLIPKQLYRDAFALEPRKTSYKDIAKLLASLGATPDEVAVSLTVRGKRLDDFQNPIAVWAYLYGLSSVVVRNDCLYSGRSRYKLPGAVIGFLKRFNLGDFPGLEIE